MNSSRICSIGSAAILLVSMLAGCSTGRIPPQSYPVVDHALIIRDLDETGRLVERFFTKRGCAVARRDKLFLHGNPAALIEATSDLAFTIKAVALPDQPPTELPGKLGCDCGTPQENILIDKSGFFDNFLITRHVSLEELDSGTTLVTVDFRYDASYYRPGGFFDSKVKCQSTGIIEAELFAWLMTPEES